MTKLSLHFFTAFLLMASASFTNYALAQSPSTSEKPRIVITCDPELDDNNSLIRFLMYSDGLQVEGLIYASSGYHWSGDGKGTKWYVPNREYSRFGLNLCRATRGDGPKMSALFIML